MTQYDVLSIEQAKVRGDIASELGGYTAGDNVNLTKVVKGKGKKTKKIVALKDDGSTNMTNTGTVSFGLGGTKTVKKINGEWHSWEGFEPNKEWKKVKPGILKKIQKKYK